MEGPEECQICSFKQSDNPRPVYHTHFSTKFLRSLVGYDAEFNCPSCKAIHPGPNESARLRILVTNGILHQYYVPVDRAGNLYPGDSLHIDQVSIPGGTLKELETAFWAEYSQETRGMDVVLVAGHDDIVRGLTVGPPFRSDQFVNDLVKIVLLLE